jgi:hypothetical protein
MPSTDTKPQLTPKSSMAQPVSQPAVYANGLMLEYSLNFLCYLVVVSFILTIKTPDLLLGSAAVSALYHEPVEGQCSANIQRRMFGLRATSIEFS